MENHSSGVSSGATTPPDARKLSAVDELALSASLRALSSESGDRYTLQRPVLCSHQWMTCTRSVRWTRWERPVSPRLQRRVTIDRLSISCPSRGGSTSPEKHLDPVCAHRSRGRAILQDREDARLAGRGDRASPEFPARAARQVSPSQSRREANVAGRRPISAAPVLLRSPHYQVQAHGSVGVGFDTSVVGGRGGVAVFWLAPAGVIKSSRGWPSATSSQLRYWERTVGHTSKRDTKKGPRRQEAGMAPPLPNSAHGDQLISAKPRGTVRFLSDLHM